MTHDGATVTWRLSRIEYDRQGRQEAGVQFFQEIACGASYYSCLALNYKQKGRIGK
jgi:hypothetical protein